MRSKRSSCIISRDDSLHLYDGTTFCEERLWRLIEARGWDWPRTSTGRYELKKSTVGKQAARYPELKPLARLRDQIAELKLNQFANTIGEDGFSRCPLLPFWTKTGRNQPSARDKMFLPGLPTWLHGLIKPPPGWAIFELDFKAEEVGLMAAFSQDPAMIEDYLAEPYIKFAVRAGLAPPEATAHTHREIRNTCKPVVLGQNYGMTAYGIARKTGKSMLWARDIAARHRLAYPIFHSWLGDVVAQARFDGFIQTPFGWPMAVTEETSNRAIMNYPAQGAGSDLLRLTAIAATEAGICIAAPVHDAVWAMAPIAEVETTITKLTEIMVKASTLVTGGMPIGVSVEAIVRAPDCLGDVRKDDDKGQPMWREIKQLVTGGLRQQARG
jgi:DNA polymerase I